MKLVLTVLARNEADVIDANIAYHLGAGADFVIATDNRSEDGTTEILESYAREGYLHLIREEGTDMRQGAWVTRMAQLAAREYGADWVIHGDADEFYWPRGGDLKEVLAAIPDSHGAVRTFVRTFLLRPGDESFAERMTVRLSTAAPIHDPSSIFRPGAKIIHRGDPRAVLGDGTHTLRGTSLVTLGGFFPIELLHFPFRTVAQTEAKFVRAWHAWTANPNRPPPHYYAKAYSAIRAGRVRDFVDSLTVDDDTLARGLEDGSLVVDSRLRDVLRELRGGETGPRRYRTPQLGGGITIEHPDLRERVRYAVEAAVLDEADVVRLRRRLDALAERLQPIAGARQTGPRVRS
ncbi:MAG TPA: glycosyltransferase family 2 protein [Gaiellaceae bacterium]|nr:glycosyltransferase family 2 protein [Gaiellaceae bacterium]